MLTTLPTETIAQARTELTAVVRRYNTITRWHQAVDDYITTGDRTIVDNAKRPPALWTIQMYERAGKLVALLKLTGYQPRYLNHVGQLIAAARIAIATARSTPTS